MLKHIKDSYYTIEMIDKNTFIIKNTKTGNNIKPWLGKNGYYTITLRGGNKYKDRKVYLHRLIAKYFIHNPDPKNKVEVNHKDGNKQNNSLDNLEWVTPSENIQHAYDTGLNHVSTMLKTDKELEEILFIYIMNGNETLTSLSKFIGLGLTQLSIRIGKIAKKIGIYDEYKKKLIKNRWNK